MKMRLFFSVLILFSSGLLGCAQVSSKVDTDGQVLERDWTIEKDILVNFVDSSVTSFSSFQVFKRHPLSKTRMISFGSFPKVNMRVRAWVVEKEALNRFVKASSLNFASLLEDPSQLKSLPKKMDGIGKPIGDVSNTSKFGDGHFFAGGSAKLFGGGTVPRIANIPDPIDENHRIVVITESAGEKHKMLKSQEMPFGRSYFYKTDSAIQIVAGSPAVRKTRKPFAQLENRTMLKDNAVALSPSLSKNASNIGVAKNALPFDHHLAIGWN